MKARVCKQGAARPTGDAAGRFLSLAVTSAAAITERNWQSVGKFGLEPTAVDGFQVEGSSKVPVFQKKIIHSGRTSPPYGTRYANRTSRSRDSLEPLSQFISTLIGERPGTDLVPPSHPSPPLPNEGSSAFSPAPTPPQSPPPASWEISGAPRPPTGPPPPLIFAASEFEVVPAGSCCSSLTFVSPIPEGPPPSLNAVASGTATKGDAAPPLPTLPPPLPTLPSTLPPPLPMLSPPLPLPPPAPVTGFAEEPSANEVATAAFPPVFEKAAVTPSVRKGMARLIGEGLVTPVTLPPVPRPNALGSAAILTKPRAPVAPKNPWFLTEERVMPPPRQQDSYLPKRPQAPAAPIDQWFMKASDAVRSGQNDRSEMGESFVPPVNRGAGGPDPSALRSGRRQPTRGSSLQRGSSDVKWGSTAGRLSRNSSGQSISAPVTLRSSSAPANVDSPEAPQSVSTAAEAQERRVGSAASVSSGSSASDRSGSSARHSDVSDVFFAQTAAQVAAFFSGGVDALLQRASSTRLRVPAVVLDELQRKSPQPYDGDSLASASSGRTTVSGPASCGATAAASESCAFASDGLLVESTGKRGVFTVEMATHGWPQLRRAVQLLQHAPAARRSTFLLRLPEGASGPFLRACKRGAMRAEALLLESGQNGLALAAAHAAAALADRCSEKDLATILEIGSAETDFFLALAAGGSGSAVGSKGDWLGAVVERADVFSDCYLARTAWEFSAKHKDKLHIIRGLEQVYDKLFVSLVERPAPQPSTAQKKKKFLGRLAGLFARKQPREVQNALPELKNLRAETLRKELPPEVTLRPSRAIHFVGDDGRQQMDCFKIKAVRKRFERTSEGYVAYAVYEVPDENKRILDEYADALFGPLNSPVNAIFRRGEKA